MRAVKTFIIALAILLPSLAQAYDVLVLQSRRDPAYSEALRGFNAVRQFSQRLIVLSDYTEIDITRIVREDQPLLVLAIGDAALAATRKLQQTPVVALMSLAIHGRGDPRQNLTGVEMFASPEEYLRLFRLMGTRRVGMVYSQDRSGWYVQMASQAARQEGIELVTREVAEPRDTLERLASLAGKVDALWMIPDTLAVTRESAEAYFHFAQDQQIPLVSFASSYLRLGAAVVVDIDRAGLGQQAAAMAASILTGNAPRDIPRQLPHKTSVKTNATVLKHLGIPQELTRSATQLKE